MPDQMPSSASGDAHSVAESILAKLNTPPSAPSEDKTKPDTTEAPETEEVADTAEGASDEETPASEEDESEAEEAAKPEKPEPQTEDDKIVEVKGEKVTLKELKRGFLREADYTRKTQALAAKERELGQGIEAERKQSKDYLDQVQTFVQTVDPLKAYEKLDWMQLAREDQANGTNNYSLLKAQYDQLKDGMDKLHTATMAAREKEHQEVRGKMQAWAKSQAEQVVEKFPELRDLKKAKAIASEMDAYAEDIGFTKEELTSQWLFRDARMWPVFRDAIAFRKAEASRKSAETKKTVVPPTVLKPKGGEGKTTGATEQRAFKRQFRDARSDRERAATIIARLHRS